MSDRKSFFATVPSIIIAIATLVGAIAGLLTILYQVGMLVIRPPSQRVRLRPNGFRVVEVLLRAAPFNYWCVLSAIFVDFSRRLHRNCLDLAFLMDRCSCPSTLGRMTLGLRTYR